MDVVFAIDSSGSMAYAGHDPSDLRLDAAAYFLGEMDPSRDTAGIISWDENVDFAKGLWSDFDATDGIEYWIYQTDSYGGTNINYGLDAAITMLDANTRTGESAEVIIFLTDGQGSYTYYEDPWGNVNTASPIYDAVTAGYVIYTIGLGTGASTGPLEDMADNTGGDYYTSASASNLQAIYDDIYTAIVTSTQPHDVQVVEVTESYITGHSDFNIAPDSITTNPDGTTTIIWNNVAQHVGDQDNILSADETVTLTFKVTANKPGFELEVQDYGEAVVKYYNGEGGYAGKVNIPQAYLTAKQSVDIIAVGGSAATATDVGDLIVWQDEDYLYVEYKTVDGWFMTETHLAVGDDKADIPQTKKNNPKVGKFPYSSSHSPGVTEYMYKIPWTWEEDALLYIAAHCVVKKQIGVDDECNPIYREETGWGDGEDLGGASWAMYVEYQDP
jgi:Ca-activated chloride channel family protein